MLSCAWLERTVVSVLFFSVDAFHRWRWRKRIMAINFMGRLFYPSNGVSLQKCVFCLSISMICRPEMPLFFSFALIRPSKAGDGRGRSHLPNARITFDPYENPHLICHCANDWIFQSEKRSIPNRWICRKTIAFHQHRHHVMGQRQWIVSCCCWFFLHLFCFVSNHVSPTIAISRRKQTHIDCDSH